MCIVLPLLNNCEALRFVVRGFEFLIKSCYANKMAKTKEESIAFCQTRVDKRTFSEKESKKRV